MVQNNFVTIHLNVIVFKNVFCLQLYLSLWQWIRCISGSLLQSADVFFGMALP